MDRVTNFDSSFDDGKALAALVSAVAPDVASKLLMETSDLAERKREVANVAHQIGFEGLLHKKGEHQEFAALSNAALLAQVSVRVL